MSDQENRMTDEQRRELEPWVYAVRERKLAQTKAEYAALAKSIENQERLLAEGGAIHPFRAADIAAAVKDYPTWHLRQYEGDL